MHLGEREVEEPVEETVHRFGTEPLGERSRIDEVAEKHRHMLAFALESALRREDFLGEVFGSVAFRGSKARLTGGLAANRRPTLVAELGPGGAAGLGRAKKCVESSRGT